MPLIQSKSKKAMSKNIAAEMDAGKPQKQSIAIAYAVKRKNEHKKKMAHGGMAMSPKMEDMPGSIAEAVMKRKKMSDGGQVDIEDNAIESDNYADELNMDALGKENYSEEDALEDLDYNTEESIGREIPSDEHDMIDKIRMKMKAKRA